MYRWQGGRLTATQQISHRLIRLPEADEAEEIIEIRGEWAPETTRGRVWVNFDFLRLYEPELLGFRLDHRVGHGGWIEGPTCHLEILQVISSDAVQPDVPRGGRTDPPRDE